MLELSNSTALEQLGETERELEVRNAFKLNIKYSDQPMHLLLVDDVLTTGATLTACASALLKNSKIKISIAVLACRL